MFVIEDEWHAEQVGEFSTREQAINELRRLAAVPWDQTPNHAPCTNCEACGRRYEMIEYDATTVPWRELERTPALEVSTSGVSWLL